MALYTHSAASTKTVELQDEIFNLISILDLDKTPVVSSIGTRDIKNVEFSHLTDSLRAANKDNAQKQGEDAPAVSDTTRAKSTNYTQIFAATVRVPGSLDAVTQYGMDTETKYQKPKKMRECKRDLEAMVISSNTAVQPILGTTAGKSAGIATIISTNVDATTHATLAASQTQFNNLLQDVVEAGGTPGYCFVSGLQKRGMAGWTTKTTFQVGTVEGAKQAVTGTDVYWADIGGPIKFRHHYMMATTHLLLLDLDYWKIAWLRKWFWKPLAETGDTSSAEELIGECGVFCKDEKSSGMMNNLASS